MKVMNISSALHGIGTEGGDSNGYKGGVEQGKSSERT